MGKVTGEEGWISLGPWGGGRGEDSTYKPDGPIIQITVYYGEHAINSILFESKSRDGVITGSSVKIGGVGGLPAKFCIDSSVEQLSSISLTFGAYYGRLTSLCFHTNLKTYGPFGPRGRHDLNISIEGGVIAGFHGHSDEFSLGIFLAPKLKSFPKSEKNVDSLLSIQDPDSAPRQLKSKTIAEEGYMSLGPYGLNSKEGGHDYRTFYKHDGAIMQITIDYGPDGIYSILFESKSHHDVIIGTSVKIGGSDIESRPHESFKFCIDSSREKFTSISLTYRDDRQVRGITSLSLFTYQKTYGPFGRQVGHGDPEFFFRKHMPIERGEVVGFHGRGGRYLEAIGVIVAPEHSSSIQDFDSTPTLLIKGKFSGGWIFFGPWGGQDGEIWDYMPDGPIMQISISYGLAINSILIESKSRDGIVTGVSKKFGDPSGGRVTKTFCIDTSKEQLLSISLAYGYFYGQVTIISLQFDTNLRTYGPFGLKQPSASSIDIPIKLERGVLWGLHGRAGAHLFAIGISVAPKLNTLQSIQSPDQAPTNLKVPAIDMASKHNIHNGASSSGTSNEDDHLGGAPSLASEIDHLDSEFQKYKFHIDWQISEARETLAVVGTESDFDNLGEDILDLKSQIPSPSSGLGPKRRTLDTPTIKSRWSFRFLVQNFKSYFCGSKPTKEEMVRMNLDHLDSVFQKYKINLDTQISKARKKLRELQVSGGGENDIDKLRKTIDKLKYKIDLDTQISEARKKLRELQVSGGGENDIDKLRKTIDKLKYKIDLDTQISEARKKLRELQVSGGGENDIDKLRKTIDKLKLQKYKFHMDLKLQIREAREKFEELRRLGGRGSDHQGGALSPDSKLIRSDLNLLKTALATVQGMDIKIQKAHTLFEELQTLPSNERTSKKKELGRDIAKLKVQLRAHGKVRSASRHWDNINNAEDGMTHFFHKEEPAVVQSDGFDSLLEDFKGLSEPLQNCLLCFFKFPPTATIKRTLLIYLWIGQGYISQPLDDDWYSKDVQLGVHADNIFDMLIAKGFIEPIYQKFSLEPDSCKMSPHVRCSLYKEAERKGFTSNGSLDLGTASLSGDRIGHSCLVNVGEAIISCEPEIFDKMKNIRSLYLGRWQCSTTHHIEVSNMKVLHGILNKVKTLTFLSLQGISMITELPIFISELNNLMILDLRACHNLERIPAEVGLLKSLTHVDMSECYFLEHMPKSLAKLSNLQVLKGFLIGDSNDEKESCSLHDLSRLKMLGKLNIYIRVTDILRMEQLELEQFEGLTKLTISWGGCTFQDRADIIITEAFKFATLPPKLQKLDLQGFPLTSLPNFLMPSKLLNLKKLYIRGGKLCYLGQIWKPKVELWTVDILKLKYLDELRLDWSELKMLFPKLIYLQQVQCPKFTNFLCDKRGIWLNEEANDTRVHEFQKYLGEKLAA